MAKEDEEKTNFITPFGTFCFVRMPEGLKNAGPTFIKMTGEVFNLQIGRNIQAYVDDLIVKSGDRENHISDLAETFANMRRVGLKLNPEKCIFGVTKGRISGCLISTKRIEANPDKIKAIREMEEPKTKKDIQKLNGRLVALNRFISRSAE
jgi:O-acetyl-ADP-ribose deacetylase (regulator of RNase III)